MSGALHDDGELFAGLLQATAEHLGIPAPMVEKDYYVSLILRRLAESDYREYIVFKGGTSLSKGYRLIDRFSEDVDFAVIHKAMRGNQVKMLLSKLMKAVTAGLAEDFSFQDVSKGSRFRKQAFSYTSKMSGSPLVHHNPISSRIIVEISAFANPFPYEDVTIEPMVTTFLKQRGLTDFIHRYGLSDFVLHVLALQQTLCEKAVSLIRFSMSDDPVAALSGKIRHFYDIHALLRRSDVEDYIQGKQFHADMQQLIRHDRQAFDNPPRWRELKTLGESPLFAGFETLWRRLAPVYERNLAAIAYRPIPSSEEVTTSFRRLMECLQGLRWDD